MREVNSLRYNEHVQLLQRNGRKGPSIVRFRYDKIKKAMLHIAGEKDWISFDELSKKTLRRLTPFDGNNQWYMEALVTDLEARGLFECSQVNGDLFIRKLG